MKMRVIRFRHDCLNISLKHSFNLQVYYYIFSRPVAIIQVNIATIDVNSFHLV